jgi:hypothetical protein
MLHIYSMIRWLPTSAALSSNTLLVPPSLLLQAYQQQRRGVNIEELDGQPAGAGKTMAMLTSLRQACCHPNIVRPTTGQVNMT